MMTKARKIASKSDHKYHRHSTLILKGGALISSGFNHGWVHSEIDAISNMPLSKRRSFDAWYEKVNGSTFINTMITKAGNYGESRPCNRCWNILKAYEIGKVIYFDGDDWVSERVR